MNINGVQGNPYQGLTQTRPYDFGTDAIERQRVSLGQAMMDADFEYGLQATKWQSYFDIRKWPTYFEIAGTDATVSNVASDGAAPYSNITIYYNTTTSQYTTLPVSNAGNTFSVVSMFGLTSNTQLKADRAEGYFLVASNTSTTANYIAKGYIPAGNVQTNLTFSRKGGIYNSATMNLSFNSLVTDGGSNIQVFTSNLHGILPGTPMTLITSNITTTGGQTANGTYLVCNVTASNTFNIVANTLTFKSGTLTNLSNAQLIVDPYGSSQHRPYDGGVLLSTLAPAHGSTVIRQSKKCFRYQSGKGILFSSGTLFAPNLDIASMNLWGLSSGMTSNANGIVGVSLTVSQPALLGLNQNVTVSPVTANCFVNANVSSISGSNVTFVYSNTFTPYLPANVTQNVVTTTLFTPPAVYVPFANTNGFAGTNFPVNIAGFGTYNVASVSSTYLTLGSFPYASIPGGTLISNATVAGNVTGNATVASTSTNPLNLSVASTNGFILGETVTFNPAVPTLGSLSVVSNASTVLGLSYTGTANTAQTIAQYTTVSGTPVNILAPGPLTVNVASGIFSSGQVVASYLGQYMTSPTITSTGTVASNAQITLSFGGSFPPQGIPTGTVVTTLPPGSNIQIVTDLQHGIPTTGATVTLRNISSSNLNGTGYTVSGVIDSRTLNVQSQSTITTTAIALGDQPRMILTGWHGASVRAGVFEEPNGMFWEYDGQTLFCVRRQSTFQCAGYITATPYSQMIIGTLAPYTGIITPAGFSVNPGDTSVILVGSPHSIQQYMYTQIAGLGYCWVIGVPDYFQVQIGFLPFSGTSTTTFAPGTLTFNLPTTRFQDQLRVNQRITIRGMPYEITSIQGQGVLTVNPPYRGITAIDSLHAVKACKVKELRVPQNLFNRDTLDGKGPSGFKFDPSRMQMIGLQYTWYGAGFIDFMMRGPDGNWVYAHRIKNNNVNDEAYMRSGNLPVRYELCVESLNAISTLATNVSNSLGNSTTDTLYVNDPTTYFPPSGTLLIDNEYINYTTLLANGFTGLTRSYPLTYIVNDIPRTFTGTSNVTHLAGTSVNLVSCTATPTLTHWGSSFLTDGQFDLERGYFFNYSNTTITLQSYQGGGSVVPGPGSNACAFAVRLAPSVTNGLTGDIGIKELLNRAQLLLQKLEVTSNVNVQTVGYLNPTGITLNSSNWLPVNSGVNGSQPSFVQYYPGNLITGVPQPGERIFQTIVQANNQNNLDLSSLKEMSNSIIGGNQNFPDGPDVLVIFVQNLGLSSQYAGGATSNAQVQVNLFWWEAQA